jgi:hypothetical protein
MQGGSVTVTSDKLDVTDDDTDDAMLSFLLLENPEHGSVFVGGSELMPNEEFIKLDIHTGEVEYRHNNDEDLLVREKYQLSAFLFGYA